MIVVEVLGPISNFEVIAVGARIREIARLRRIYGSGRWRKMKGTATIRLIDLQIVRAEIHWYEAHGIGKYEFKAVRILTNN
jgi:hypothetical protein